MLQEFVNSIGIRNDINHMIALFFIYSFLGWVVESIYMSLCNRRITNRGFIRGPLCPIYGVGEWVVYTALYPFNGNFVILFFAGAAFASLVEYIKARITISKFGTVWWDYGNKPFNYKGILCLESTIAWGIYTIVEFGFLHKVLTEFVLWIPQRILYGIMVALTVYLIVSLVLAYRRYVKEGTQSKENDMLSFD